MRCALRSATSGKFSFPFPVVLVASCKGGVGKSTISASLAAFYAGRGKKIGVLDADVYGSSIPSLLRSSSEKSNGWIPVKSRLVDGIECMSAEYFANTREKTFVWRGLLVTRLLQDMLLLTEWSEDLDCLIVDMPPGTGDAHLTIAERICVSGAFVVTTAQKNASEISEKTIHFLSLCKIPVRFVHASPLALGENSKLLSRQG